MKSATLNKTMICLSLLGILSACSPVKFDKAVSKSVGSTSTNGGGGTVDTGDDTGTGGGGTVPTGDDTGTGGGGTTTPPGTNTHISYSQTVAGAKNQVDFLFIIDASTSMAPEQAKLASKLESFVTRLNALQVDWQMCLTVTHVTTNKFGVPVDWAGNTNALKYVLKKGATGLDAIFKNTINGVGAGAPGTGDERGIRAAYGAFAGEDVKSKNCFRTDSSVSVILLSDEDERSVAGILSRVKMNDKTREDDWKKAGSIGSHPVAMPLEAADLPENLVAKAKTALGNSSRFTFNSIIQKTGDTACMNAQDTALDFGKYCTFSTGCLYPSYEGTQYEKISSLTNGGVASICDADYGPKLELFAGLTTNYQKDFSLKCAPVAGTLSVVVKDSAGVVSPQPSFTVSGATLSFGAALKEFTVIDFKYDCAAVVP
jgi:hypothetical protein